MSYVAYFLHLALILDVLRELGIKMSDYDVEWSVDNKASSR
jgi:hypothetical protein